VAKILISQVHGGWKEENGFVAIPEGTTLYLFQEPGNVMFGAQADWGAFASIETLSDLAGLMAKLKGLGEEERNAMAQKWEAAGEAFMDDPDLADYFNEQGAALEKAVLSVEGLALLPLIADDIVHDYTIGSLGMNDMVFAKGKQPDPNVTLVRSKILSKVEGNIVGLDGDKLLSDILAKYKGNEIYWFACQEGAGVKPEKELADMQDPSKVKRV
jgi:hypothetical protein